MKKTTGFIMITVMISFLACFVVAFILVGNANDMTAQYEDVMSMYVQSKDDMSKVSENIYHIQSLLWNHIITDDVNTYENCEMQINALEKETDQLFERLSGNITDSSQKEELHQVSNAYSGLKSHIEVVYGLSRDSSKESAKYYISSNINDYLKNINDSLRFMSSSLNEDYQQAVWQLEQIIKKGARFRKIGIVIICLVVILSIFMVSAGGHRIITTQDDMVRKNQEKIMNLQNQVIIGMANLIESRDGETGEHVKRTSAMVGKLARELKNEGYHTEILTDEYIDLMVKAAPLHDVGKIRIPDSVLQKPGKLTPEEFEIIKLHAAEGGSIIYETMREIEEKDYLEIAHDMATYHHEKWNGCGYPLGKKGENIPLCARIMAVADVFDALVSKRCYKEAFPMKEAIDIIDEGSGNHFDPAVVKAFDVVIADYIKNGNNY